MEIRNQSDMNKAMRDGVEAYIVEPGTYKAADIEVNIRAQGVALYVTNGTVFSNFGEGNKIVARKSLIYGYDSNIEAYGSYVNASRSKIYASDYSIVSSFVSTITAWESAIEADNSIISASNCYVLAKRSIVHSDKGVVDCYGGTAYGENVNLFELATNGKIANAGYVYSGEPLDKAGYIAKYADIYNLKQENGLTRFYKAVDDDFTTDRGVDYSPGKMPACEDYNALDICGGGLHFSPTPLIAKSYFVEATRFVEAWVDTYTVITGDSLKIKAPKVVRPLVEVDITGKRI